MGWVEGKHQSHEGECSNRDTEGKAERFLHRESVPTSTHQPEVMACLLPGAGRSW